MKNRIVIFETKQGWLDRPISSKFRTIHTQAPVFQNISYDINSPIIEITEGRKFKGTYEFLYSGISKSSGDTIIHLALIKATSSLLKFT